ncbi:hypothetical protein BamIOP4010DRAFT_1529 [Burkholderia ambifaria IOP40-10]|uniref:Uncharacterized protein n=1 Tax=Burkholderia ambifaria IOP40-10 TaxID=396596 RepID=B1FBX0_9BURK|nr:hypothetical protein [Burkholderia ambifaria]EDT04986.1 hypothetical protein BamIOP4010DRAFT_1529 [Burkholderia ambifaria IOP40-10]
MNLNVPSMTTYPTDPASYLQRLTNGASTSSTQDVLKDLIGLISQLLKQMQTGQNGQAGGMPGGAAALAACPVACPVAARAQCPAVWGRRPAAWGARAPCRAAPGG